MKSTELAKELGVKASDIVAAVARLRGRVYKKGTTTLKLTAAESSEIRGFFSGLQTSVPDAEGAALAGSQDIPVIGDTAATAHESIELPLHDADAFPAGIAAEPDDLFAAAAPDGAGNDPDAPASSVAGESDLSVHESCGVGEPLDAGADPTPANSVETSGTVDAFFLSHDQTGAIALSKFEATVVVQDGSLASGESQSSDAEAAVPPGVEPESAPEQFPTWHGDRHTLETRHLGKSYGSKHAVRNVSFSVQTGEVVGLLGPNGAGKTTTFYMVVGAIRPDQGEILLNGKDLRSMPMYQRALNGLGYLPQEPSIFRKLTVRENLKAVLEIRWKSIKKKEDRLDIDEEVQGLLEEFNLTEFADRDGYHLSGGERRRTEIARAVALRPTFLLFDEPFAGIDPIAIIELKKMIVYLKQKGLGILITDHNVRETLSITDRAYIIKDGTVFAAGAPEDLVANRDVREAYLGEDFRLS